VRATTLLAFVLSAASGWPEALRHASFVALAVLALVEVVAVTVPFVPFTRTYEPGHAKLKTRWPLYAIAVYVFAFLLVRIEQAYRSDPIALAILLLCLAGVAGALDIAGQVRARRRSLEPSDEFADDEGRIAVLDIGAVVHRA
jgi:hypothetical protein